MKTHQQSSKIALLIGVLPYIVKLQAIEIERAVSSLEIHAFFPVDNESA